MGTRGTRGPLHSGTISHPGATRTELDGGDGVGMVGTSVAELKAAGCWPPKIGTAVSFERGTFGPNQISGATNVEKVERAP
jgi:hypothetical protein